MKDKLQEIIDFFKLERESWARDDVVRECAYKIKALQGHSLDEIGLEWDGGIFNDFR